MVNKTYNAADLDAFMKIAASWQNNTLAEDFGGKNNDMQNYLNPAMNLYKKRERTQNWNHQEKKFLLELCRKDMRIIENKRLDAGLTAVKNKAWKIIHQKFSEAFGTDRTCNRLKEQWRRMKACTRNEILDYNNRVGRYGQEAADRKKPSPFTFEIWDFMQEAKKQCKSEALDGVDYSKVPLALEEDFEFNESTVNDENERDAKPSHHDLCDVRIKEEDADSDENDNNNDGRRSGSVDCLSSPNDDSNIASSNNDLPNHISSNNFSQDTNTLSTSFNISNIAATLETLNALRNNFTLNNNNSNSNNNSNNNINNNNNNGHNNQQNGTINDNQQQQSSSLPPAKRQRRTSSNSSSLQLQQQTLGSLTISTNSSLPQSTELKIFMEMQAKEHLLRMQILETQLQTAKYNRDIVEINKTIALQKLHDIANRRMS